MGLTITSKSKKCPYSLDCGYFGFTFLRCEIALALFPEFGEKYKAYHLTHIEEKQLRLWKDVCSIGNTLLNAGKMKAGFAEFIVKNDSDATISVKYTHGLWEQIKDLELDIKFGYQGQSDCATFSDFKNLVKWCVENKRCLRWY